MGWIIAVIVLAIIIGIIKYKMDQGGKATNARLRGYGIVVDGDKVKAQGKVLGDLAGSRAEIAGLTARHTLTRAVTVVGAATKKTDFMVVITFPNGAIHTKKGQSAGEYRRAAQFVTKYNAMAQPDFPATPLASA